MASLCTCGSRIIPANRYYYFVHMDSEKYVYTWITRYNFFLWTLQSTVHMNITSHLFCFFKVCCSTLLHFKTNLCMHLKMCPYYKLSMCTSVHVNDMKRLMKACHVFKKWRWELKCGKIFVLTQSRWYKNGCLIGKEVRERERFIFKHDFCCSHLYLLNMYIKIIFICIHIPVCSHVHLNFAIHMYTSARYPHVQQLPHMYTSHDIHDSYMDTHWTTSSLQPRNTISLRKRKYILDNAND